MTVDRRSFLRTGAKYAGGALAAPSLIGLMACNDVSPSEPEGVARLARAQRGNGGYGPIAADASGLPFLIPAGFTLRQLSKAGDLMKGTGTGVVPNAFDGMAAFQMSNGNVRLIRNHEMRDNAAQSVPIGIKPWDAKAGGGCTSLEVSVDTLTGEPTVIDEFVVLSGTTVNCAGGPTPWGSWLTCEETIEGTAQGRLKEHGYIFEIPVSASSEIDAVSLNAMGRFSHEAIAVDAAYGHVYETEDAGTSSGFYRFIPNVQGDLKQGGKLQMLALVGKPQFDASRGGTPAGIPLPAHWVDVPAPDQTSPSCFNQGFTAGGVRFARLEGCWWGDSSVYFNSTSGGAVGVGQVWQYRPLTVNTG
ncbi:MAG: alkaline phosphatase PhoX, partial [Gemmatimonadaceae bacterium]